MCGAQLNPAPHRRALERLAGAGITAGIAVAPIIPGLSDDPCRLGELIRAARDAGAAFLSSKALYLQPGARDPFLEELARHWPAEAARRFRLYRHSSYLASSVTHSLDEIVDALRLRYRIPCRTLVPAGDPPLQPALF